MSVSARSAQALVAAASGASNLGAGTYYPINGNAGNTSTAPLTAGGYLSGLNTGDIIVGPYDQLAIDLNLTALGGSSTVTLFYDRKGADGVYYGVAVGTALSATGAISKTIGIGGSVNESPGQIGRIRVVVTGTGATFTCSVIGK